MGVGECGTGGRFGVKVFLFTIMFVCLVIAVATCLLRSGPSVCRIQRNDVIGSGACAKLVVHRRAAMGTRSSNCVGCCRGKGDGIGCNTPICTVSGGTLGFSSSSARSSSATSLDPSIRSKLIARLRAFGRGCSGSGFSDVCALGGRLRGALRGTCHAAGATRLTSMVRDDKRAIAATSTKRSKVISCAVSNLRSLAISGFATSGFGGAGCGMARLASRVGVSDNSPTCHLVADRG